MPKGRLNFSIASISTVRTEEEVKPLTEDDKTPKFKYEPVTDQKLYTQATGLLFLVKKKIALDGEEITETLDDKEWQGNISFLFVYDSYFYDDYIEIEVYKDNRATKNNMLGSGQINLREVEDLSLSEMGIFPVTIRKADTILGECFVRLKYTPIDVQLLNS